LQVFGNLWHVCSGTNNYTTLNPAAADRDVAVSLSVNVECGDGENKAQSILKVHYKRHQQTVWSATAREQAREHSGNLYEAPSHFALGRSAYFHRSPRQGWEDSGVD